MATPTPTQWNPSADPVVANGAPGYRITASGRIINAQGKYVTGTQPGAAKVIPPSMASSIGPVKGTTGKATAAPPGVQGPTDVPTGFDLPPDVSRAWHLFTDALGTHFPRGMTRALLLGRRMSDAVK